MKNMKKVSMVIPSYNHEKYIKRTIKSVLNQTYKNIELIIIDDGSEDNSADICKDFAEKYSNIKFYSQENAGAHNTINRCISLATGEYISVLNSDDIYKEDKIRRCVDIIQNNPKIELIFGEIEFINDKGSIITSGVEKEWRKRALDYFKKTNYLQLSILNENFITTTSNLFFTKKLWESVGGFQPLRYCHDLDFIITSLRQAEYYYDNHVHIQYRIHSSNTIKETVTKVQIEVAAVTAVSVVEDNINLIKKLLPENIEYLKLFLKNKNLSNIIILCIMLYINIKDRNKFYDLIMQDETKLLLIAMLK